MSEPCSRNERSGCDDADCCRPKSLSRGADGGATDAEYAADCCTPTPIVPTPPVDTDPRRKPCETKDPEKTPSSCPGKSSSYGRPEKSPSCGRPEKTPSSCPEKSSSCGRLEKSPSCGRPEKSPSCGRPEKSPSCGRPEKSPSDCRARVDPCCTAVKAPRRAGPNCAGTGCCVAANDCADCDLTDYAREYVANTGRLIQSCACIKFNGLQDSCRHSGCISTTRTGCMDNPFPSCLPAQKWKCDFICKNKKKPDEC